LVIRVSTWNVQKKKRNLVYIIKELNIIFSEKEVTRELHFVVLLCIILMMDPVFYVVSLYFQLKTHLTIFEALNMILIFLLAVQQEFQAT
jgi:Ca2+/Na+ antiporter